MQITQVSSTAPVPIPEKGILNWDFFGSFQDEMVAMDTYNKVKEIIDTYCAHLSGEMDVNTGTCIKRFPYYCFVDQHPEMAQKLTLPFNDPVDIWATLSDLFSAKNEKGNKHHVPLETWRLLAYFNSIATELVHLSSLGWNFFKDEYVCDILTPCLLYFVRSIRRLAYEMPFDDYEDQKQKFYAEKIEGLYEKLHAFKKTVYKESLEKIN